MNSYQPKIFVYTACLLFLSACAPSTTDASYDAPSYTISDAAHRFGEKLERAFGASPYFVRVGRNGDYIYSLATKGVNPVAAFEEVGRQLAGHDVERPVQLDLDLGENDTEILAFREDGVVTVAITAPRTWSAVERVQAQYADRTKTSWGESCVAEGGVAVFSLTCKTAHSQEEENHPPAFSASR